MEIINIYFFCNNMYKKYRNVKYYNGDFMREYNFDISDVNLDLARKISKNRALTNKYLPIKIINKELLLLAPHKNIKDTKELEFLYASKIKVKETREEYVLSLIEAVFFGQEDNIFEEILKRAINLNSQIYILNHKGKIY